MCSCFHQWSNPEFVKGLWGHYNGWAHRCSKCKRWEVCSPSPLKRLSHDDIGINLEVNLSITFHKDESPRKYRYRTYG